MTVITASPAAPLQGVFAAGVDTHTDTHTLAVLDPQGRIVHTETFPATPTGYQCLADAITSTAGRVHVGVEGTNSYGAGLTRALQADGLTVSEVLRPTRQVRRMDGKSDPVDAIAAARAVLSGHGLSTPKVTTGSGEALRYLHVARRKLVSVMSALSNQISSLLVTAPEPIRGKYQHLHRAERISALARCRPGGTDPSSLDSNVLTVLKTLACTHRDLASKAAMLTSRIKAILEQHQPALLDVYGIGPVTAAALVIAAGDNPERIGNQAAFAKLCGACPIPASSGRTQRHRLNRGGNREANKALHHIAVVRMGRHEPTQAYVARQRAKGKSNPEILRQLKRALCREIYRALTTTQTPNTSAEQLRETREAKGLSQSQAARALGVYPARINDIEHQRRPLPDLKQKYENWLKTA